MESGYSTRGLSGDHRTAKSLAGLLGRHPLGPATEGRCNSLRGASQSNVHVHSPPRIHAYLGSILRVEPHLYSVFQGRALGALGKESLR